MGFELARREEDSDDSHQKRILQWVTQNGVVIRTDHVDGPIDIWQGKRLQQPSGLGTAVIIFHVRTPRQPAWPPSLVPPPITPHFHTLAEPGDDLQALIETALSQEKPVDFF